MWQFRVVKCTFVVKFFKNSLKKNAYKTIKLQTKFCFSIWTTRNQQSAQEYKNYFRQFHLLDGNKDVFPDEIEVGWNRWHTSVSENFPPDQASDWVSWVIFYMSFQAFFISKSGHPTPSFHTQKRCSTALEMVCIPQTRHKWTRANPEVLSFIKTCSFRHRCRLQLQISLADFIKALYFVKYYHA